MKLTAYPFLLHPAEKNKLLTRAEHDGLCCLLDRAKYFGGDGDVLFLCMSTCSVLVRFAPDQAGIWCASGFAFQKQMEQWAWLYLPSLLGTVLTPHTGNLQFRIDTAAQADEWLQRHDAALAAAAQHLKHDTARQMHPYSVGFTHLDPSVYGDDSIVWYTLEPQKQAESNIETHSAVDCTPKDGDAVITPPKLLRGWRILQGDDAIKLSCVSETENWYTFAARVRQAIKR